MFECLAAPFRIELDDELRQLLSGGRRERDRLAYDFRDDLGVIVGDLRIHGDDVTRFEVYWAPFRIQLTERLARHLTGKWRYRDPVLEAGPQLTAPWL